MNRTIITTVIISIFIFLSMNCYCQDTKPLSGNATDTVITNGATKGFSEGEDSTQKESKINDNNQRSTRRRSPSDSNTKDNAVSEKKLLNPSAEKKIKTKKNAVTIGYLQGGGSFIGFDFERLIYKNIGIQIGAGFMGVGAGLNFHTSSTINSPFISLSYWGQGIAGSLSQISAGPTIVHRGDWFTAQIGLGFILSRG